MLSSSVFSLTANTLQRNRIPKANEKEVYDRGYNRVSPYQSHGSNKSYTTCNQKLSSFFTKTSYVYSFHQNGSKVIKKDVHY